ncbi:uncharacterized protein YALI1_F36781g [Yarrowia lipolytica]|jgi:hypothetical protein|uniref:Uncharacterized protein n=1 Tax=Yarrowia lipolytica TaxID=4952 RepID=A0A1D8NQE0_YARLL|nr:hypothetical protein YALI1_F36781g [Yarrowia lipolytica]
MLQYDYTKCGYIFLLIRMTSIQIQTRPPTDSTTETTLQMITTELSQHDTWSLGLLKACQLVCLATLFLVLNDFIMRALGKDHNKTDGWELNHLKRQLWISYEHQCLLSSQLVQVCDIQQDASRKAQSTQAKYEVYIDQNQIPFFRSYNWRDTRKQLYCPQNVWFCGGFDGTFTKVSTTREDEHIDDYAISSKEHSNEEYFTSNDISGYEHQDASNDRDAYFQTSPDYI